MLLLHRRHYLAAIPLMLCFAGSLAQPQNRPPAEQPQRVPPGQPRALALPDTMGANFDIADSLTAHGSTADYDNFLGDWRFKFQFRRADGQWNPPFSGTWSFGKKDTRNGLVIDHWRPDNDQVGADEGKFTFRAFNRARGLWEIQGVDTDRGRFDGGLGWSDGANRYLIQRNGAAIMRIRYFAITPDHFLWRADRSNDGGKTWLRDTWSMEVNRQPQ